MAESRRDKKQMKELVNINMGIDSMAKSCLAVKAEGVTFNMDYGKKHFPDSETYSRVGTVPSIELKRYKMKDGGFAEEFVQAVVKTKDGRRLHFLGLNINGTNKIWPMSKMRERIIKETCSKA